MPAASKDFFIRDVRLEADLARIENFFITNSFYFSVLEFYHNVEFEEIMAQKKDKAANYLLVALSRFIEFNFPLHPSSFRDCP